MAKTTTRQKDRTIVFVVRTPRPLPVGEQVFVSGDQPMLGSWRPDGLPLTRMDDETWTASARLPAGVDVLYKITRGGWGTEEVAADGAILPNSVVAAASPARVERTVARWRDD